MRCKINNLKPIKISILLIVIFASCNKDGKEKIPDVSDIKVETNIYRFEKELFNVDTTRFSEELKKLKNKYPEFTKVFIENVMAATDPKVAPEGTDKYLKGFISAPQIRKLYDTCQIVFKDFRPTEKEFDQAFKYLKYYFPKQRVPTVTTFISEYSFGVFVYGKGDLGVGLDFFLGNKYPYAKYNFENPNFSLYLTRTYNKEHLVSKAMNVLIDDWLGGAPERSRLLDYMIYNGKKMYALDRILPASPDSVKWEYSQKQVNWVNHNEQNIWAYFTSENMLFSEDYQKIRKYVEYSPNSPGMPAEAPGRTANWIGLQIIKAYMKTHPEVNMDELFKMKDAQKILDQSKYKPKRN